MPRVTPDCSAINQTQLNAESNAQCPAATIMVSQQNSCVPITVLTMLVSTSRTTTSRAFVSLPMPSILPDDECYCPGRMWHSHSRNDKRTFNSGATTYCIFCALKGHIAAVRHQLFIMQLTLQKQKGCFNPAWLPQLQLHCQGMYLQAD